MICFRVDKRNFEKGDIIEPTSEYLNELDDLRAEIEDVLEKNRKVSELSRKEALFLFARLSDAVEFCRKEIDSYIYKVELNEEDCKFRADMNIVDYMSNASDLSDNLAKRYWNGGRLAGVPCYEYLAKSARVISKITDSESCRVFENPAIKNNEMEYYKRLIQLFDNI